MVLAEVFSEVFEEPVDSFTEESNQETVLGWTSMRHVALLVKIENVYETKFSNAEMATMRTMGDIRAALARKGVRVS